MARFALLRLAGGAAVVLLVTSGAWLLLRALRPDAFPPGEPVLGGLGAYLADAFLRFELGRSQIQGGRPVEDLIAEGLPADLLVLGGAVVLGLAAGIAGGGWCAAWSCAATWRPWPRAPPSPWPAPRRTW
jgi:ABC-type dipeptide/oligopeptide/nickel transport system permease component